MKLSVSLICFQEVDYIRQAIDGILMQRTNFPFEIIVGDDASTDGTREVLRAIEAEHPHRIRLLLFEQNFGDSGLSNFMATLNACRGEYIALLDGDDYWTDNEKLQRQVDFLEQHADCSLCAHRVMHVFDDGTRRLSPKPPGGEGVHDVGCLLKENFAHKLSTVVRRDAAMRLPDWYLSTQLASADWLFNVLSARFGKVGFIDRVMAVYRHREDNLTAYYGAERMLADKLLSFDTLRAYFPDHEKAFRAAERTVRRKRYVARISPRTYRLFQKLYGTPG